MIAKDNENLVQYSCSFVLFNNFNFSWIISNISFYRVKAECLRTGWRDLWNLCQEIRNILSYRRWETRLKLKVFSSHDSGVLLKSKISKIVDIKPEMLSMCHYKGNKGCELYCLNYFKRPITWSNCFLKKTYTSKLFFTNHPL